MDLRFSEEQDLLRSSARKLLEKECGREAILEMWQDEEARSIAYYAAWAIDQGGKDADIAASAAKAYCSEMYNE